MSIVVQAHNTTKRILQLVVICVNQKTTQHKYTHNATTCIMQPVNRLCVKQPWELKYLIMQSPTQNTTRISLVRISFIFTIPAFEIIIHSRLNYWLISVGQSYLIKKAHINPGNQSDHSIISVTLDWAKSRSNIREYKFNLGIF